VTEWRGRRLPWRRSKVAARPRARALIGDVGDESAALERTRSQRRVPIEFVKPNPRNPRRHFAGCRTRRTRGIDPRTRHHPADPGAHHARAIDQYEINRRRAALARCPARRSAYVPVVLLEVSDREALELAIIETCSVPISTRWKKANGYQALADEFKYSQDDIAKIVGKSRSHVTNTIGC